MDPKAVALQLRKLASDPENQGFIAREATCLSGLISFLNMPQEDVVLISLQALQFLASHPNNKELLSSQPGLLSKLAQLTESENVNIHNVASGTLEHLTSLVNGQKKKKKSEETLKTRPKYLFNVPLQIDDMRTNNDLARIEKVILSVRGVVSITAEMAFHRVTVYTTCKEADIVDFLVAAVRGEGYHPVSGNGMDKTPSPVKQRTRPSYPKPSTGGENIPENQRRPMNAGEGGVGRKRPTYLKKGQFAQDANTKALTQFGDIDGHSLKARMRRKQQRAQEQKKKESKVKSIFGTVTSFFW